jgi:hypothetical protein
MVDLMRTLILIVAALAAAAPALCWVKMSFELGATAAAKSARILLALALVGCCGTIGLAAAALGWI